MAVSIWSRVISSGLSTVLMLTVCSTESLCPRYCLPSHIAILLSPRFMMLYWVRLISLRNIRCPLSRADLVFSALRALLRTSVQVPISAATSSVDEL